jgi:hypothetical protein
MATSSSDMEVGLVKGAQLLPFQRKIVPLEPTAQPSLDEIIATELRP